MSKPRLHHYLPRFHLASFADGESRVWTYDRMGKLTPNPRLIHVGSIAAEAHLYDDDAPDDPVEGVEEWLASNVDGPASSALKKVLGRESIATWERESIARYAMSLDLRTPATREFILSIARQRIGEEYDARVADATVLRAEILKSSGVDIPEREIEELRAMFRPEIPKGFWLEFMQRHIVDASDRLLAKGWTLFHAADGCEFIVSDIGVLKHRDDWSKPVQGGPGWWYNADGWLIPLSPKLILAMAPGLSPAEKLAESPFVDQLNASVARLARRFVFAGSQGVLQMAMSGA